MNERGTATTELTLVVPVILGLLLLVVLAGRVTAAHSDVVAVARDAARAASFEDDPAAATVAAAALVHEALRDTECAGASVDTAVRPGPEGHMRGGVVSVEISCVASLADLALLAVPGSITVTARGSEAIDRHRALRR